MKNNKGITLIALVITIIVLLILVGVTLAMLSGDSSIFTKAVTASQETYKAQAKEVAGVVISELITDYYDAKYVNKSATDANVLAYVKNHITEKENVYKDWLDYADGKFTLKDKSEEGTIDTDGKITWAAVTAEASATPGG